jgi:hypothetical protein
VSEEVAKTTKANIISQFPSQATRFEESLASMLLCHLSEYFWLQEYPSASLAECHRSVDLTKPVLKSLSTLTFCTDSKSPVSDDVDNEFEGFFVPKRSKQRDRKKNRRAGLRTMSIDAKPFERLNLDVPRSESDASNLERQLLNDQKDILTVCTYISRSTA